MNNFWDKFNNEDGTINTNHSVFQLGRSLYDAQVVVADIEKGKPPEPEIVKNLLIDFCHLINAVGQLRAEYKNVLEKHMELKINIKKLCR